MPGNGLGQQRGLQQSEKTEDNKMAYVPSTFERKWPTIILTPISVANHIVTVSDTAGLHEKQKITLSAVGEEALELEIKRVLSDTTFQVGEVGSDMALYANPIAYSGGTLTMSEQPRNAMGGDIVLRAVYEEGPAVALRNLLVNKYGEPFGSVKDNAGINRLAVDGQFHADVDVQVDVDIDGVWEPGNPDPDNIGLIGNTRSITPGPTNQIQRLTGKPGTVNTDTISLDVSIHDHLGNEFTQQNPVPTKRTNVLVPENHDEIVLTRDPVTFVITQAVYKLATATVATVAFDRDAFLNLTRAYRV